MDISNKPTLLVAIGKAIKDIRLEQNMTQEELAEAGGFHRNFISELERGLKAPSVFTIFTLAHIFGMKPSELLQHVEEFIEIE